MTTSYNDPFNVARRLASLDLISGGRSGWNVVTSGDAGAAANFSRDEHFDYDTRYARGLEFVRVARACGTPTRQDAFPRDRATRTFLDPTRQHALNHRGEHFQVAGPLNVSRSPQGQPVIFQAGDSEQGRDLGATIGEGIFTFAPSIERPRRSTTTSRAAPPPRAEARTRSSSCRPSRSTSATPTPRPARSSMTCRPGTGTSTGPWPSSAARSPGTTSASTTWTPRSRRQALVYAERGFRTGAEKIAKLAADNGFTLRQTVEFISSPRPTPFAGSPETVADTDPGVVRGPRPRRAQPAHRPPEPVAPLPRGHRPDPPGPRPGPHRVRLHHPARQPRPPDSGQPLHQGPRRGRVPPENLKPQPDIERTGATVGPQGNTAEREAAHARRVHRHDRHQERVRDPADRRPGHRPRLRQALRPGARGRRVRPGAHRLQLDPARRHPGRRLRRRAHRAPQLPGRAPSGLRRADPGGAGRSPPWTSSPAAGSRCTSSPAAATPSSAATATTCPRTSATTAPTSTWTSSSRPGPPRSRSPTRAATTRSRTSTPRSALRSSRGSGSTSAAPRPRPTGSAASTPTPTPCGASPWRRRRSRSTRSTPPPRRRAAPTPPASA